MNQYIRELVDGHIRSLQESPRDMKNIFEIMFSDAYGHEIMAEYKENGRKVTVTFAEGKKKIANAAWQLQQELGSCGQYVALDMENSLDWITAFWGILMSGNKPYLVNRRHPKELTAGIVNTLNIAYAVAEDRVTYPAMVIRTETLRAEGHEDFAGEDFANEFALSTSATTLNEVICIYTGQQVAAQLLDAEQVLKTNDLVATFYHGALKQLAFLPFYHIFGLMAVYFWFAFYNRPMVFIPDMAGETILNTVKEFEVTHVFGVPMLWHTMEEQILATVKARGEKTEKKFYKGLKLSTKLQIMFPRAGRKWAQSIMKEVTDQTFGRSIAFLISGGGYIRESALYLFNGLGYPLHNGYGMSEVGITSVELRDSIKARNENSIGRPFASVKYQINEEGVLEISGESICRELIRNGETIEINGFYNSGDIVTVDADGNYFMKGRKGDLVIGENGENINPDETEKHFQLEKAQELCVFGHGDGACEKLAIVVQISRDLSGEDIKALADQVYQENAKLPMSVQVKEFFFSFDPIRNEQAIKVSRAYLKRGLANGTIALATFEEVLSGEVAGREPVDENDELAVYVRHVIAGFVEKPEAEITMDDNIIFDLGSNSMDYFSMVLKMNEELGVQMVFDRDSACYTIREFCREIKRLRNETADQ